jgi:tRNA dimethylallyltransferase
MPSGGSWPVDFGARGGLAEFVSKPQSSQIEAILIAGPTASGKSALTLRLAERLNGAIVNADSMQVYRDLRIITARPTFADEARAPHLLYGHVDAAVNYSVGRWCEDARKALAEIAAAGRLPMFVGGTGLYFKALTQGLSHVPPIPPEIRAAVRARCDAEGAAALHADLMRRDPAVAARLKPGDRMRIARALEVLEATGRSLADWHRDGMPAILDPERAVKLFLDDRRRNGDRGARRSGRRAHLRLSRRRGAADLRRAVPAGQGQAHPRAPRAGRGACGRRLCALDRQGRRACW